MLFTNAADCLRYVEQIKEVIRIDKEENRTPSSSSAPSAPKKKQRRAKRKAVEGDEVSEETVQGQDQGHKKKRVGRPPGEGQRSGKAGKGKGKEPIDEDVEMDESVALPQDGTSPHDSDSIDIWLCSNSDNSLPQSKTTSRAVFPSQNTVNRLVPREGKPKFRRVRAEDE